MGLNGFLVPGQSVKDLFDTFPKTWIFIQYGFFVKPREARSVPATPRRPAKINGVKHHSKFRPAKRRLLQPVVHPIHAVDCLLPQG
jgi:hypothetical protein